MVFFSMNLFDCFSRLQLEFTDDPAVLEGEGRDDEAEVEEKHWQAKQFRHLPPRTEDAEENEEQHWEKQNDGATQPLAGNLDGGLIENAVEKPRDRQPEKDVTIKSFTLFLWRVHNFSRSVLIS